MLTTPPARQPAGPQTRLSRVLLEFRLRSAYLECGAARAVDAVSLGGFTSWSTSPARLAETRALQSPRHQLKSMEPETEGPPPTIPVTPLQQMIASCTGAVLTSLMVTPLDVVKIRLQAQNNPFPKGKCFLYSNGLMDHMCVCEEESKKAWYKKPGNFRGTLDAFLKILRNEGIKSLWSGLPPTLVMAIPATVIYFTCYEQLSAFLKTKLGENETRIPIVAGVVARFGAVTVISPLELIRTKVQSKKFSYKELYQFVSMRVSEDGWISLWKGWAPTILRDVPFSAMYWYNYENLKRWLCEKSGLYEPTFMINFTSGALSGSFAAVATLPFDVVKTQKQTQLWTNEYCKFPAPLDMSTWTIMKNIVADKGFSGLFTGLIPRLVKIVPACAIMISSYELGKSFFQKQNVESR